MAKKDRVYLGPPNEQGQHAYLRDRGEGDVTIGVLGKHVEGSQGYLEIKRVEGEVYDVVRDIPYTCSTPRGGPPKVNTDTYRQNWGRIFGKPTVGQA